MPTGMLVSGSALPGLMSASAPAITMSPTFRPLRGDDIALLAVLVLDERDVRANGWGRTPGSGRSRARPALSRLKSMMRYFRAVAAAAVADGDAAVVVAAGSRFLMVRKQTFLRSNLRQLRIEIGDSHLTGWPGVVGL